MENHWKENVESVCDNVIVSNRRHKSQMKIYEKKDGYVERNSKW